MAQGECREIIYSNDYADLIADHSGGIRYLEEAYAPDCVQPINSRFFLLYKKRDGSFAENMSYGYSVMPRCYGLMDLPSLEVSGITEVRQQSFLELSGRGVLIGLVDTGIDYTHPAFRQTDGSTRIAAIWDQTKEEGPGNGLFDYGRVYTREELNLALQQPNPLETADTFDRNGHGTFMAGIAAGNLEPEENFSGAAPNATIAVVKLKEAKQYLRDFYMIPDDVPCYQENDIMAGIRYLLGLAAELEMPVVILLGIGTSMGDHTGRGKLGQYIGTMIGIGGMTIVCAAGNEGNGGRHYRSGDLDREAYEDVEFQVGTGENGFVMELWADTAGTVSVGLISPSGEYTDKITIRPGQLQRVPFILESTVVSVYYNLTEAGSGDELVFIRLSDPTEGIWRLRVFNEGNRQTGYHIWMPIGQFVKPDTRFLAPDPYVTITDPGNDEVVITATAYDYRNDSLYLQASRGYSRIGLVKPELAAPGVSLRGPLPGGRYGERSGTSAAAAHTAGAVAMLLEWGLSRRSNIAIGPVEIKQLLIRGARQLNLVYPNPSWGYGMLDLAQTFENLRRTT